MLFLVICPGSNVLFSRIVLIKKHSEVHDLPFGFVGYISLCFGIDRDVGMMEPCMASNLENFNLSLSTVPRLRFLGWNMTC